MRCNAVNCIKELKRAATPADGAGKFTASAYAIERTCPAFHIFKSCPYQSVQPKRHS